MRSITRAFRRQPAEAEAAKEPSVRTARRSAPPAPSPVIRFQFFRDVVSELHKVTWPTRDEVIRLTVLVSGMSVAVGAALGLLDLVFTELVRQLLSLGR